MTSSSYSRLVVVAALALLCCSDDTASPVGEADASSAGASSAANANPSGPASSAAEAMDPTTNGNGDAAAGDATGPAPDAALIHLAEGAIAPEVDSGHAPAREPRVWSLAGEQAEWRPLTTEDAASAARLEMEAVEDGVRLAFPQPGSFRVGGLVAEVGDLRLQDWESVIVKARSHDRFAGVTVVYNVEERGAFPGPFMFFQSTDNALPVFNDGSVQNYAIPLRPRGGQDPDSFHSLAVLFGAPGPAKLELLSVTLVPRGAGFPEDVGSCHVARDGLALHTLFAHAPARLRYALPGAERLDFALTVNRGETVTYRVRAGTDDEAPVLFEHTVNDSAHWQQHSIDLTAAGAAPLDLVLEADSEDEGAVGLWGAPVVATGREDPRPDVLFYVIDGGDADLMSLYGYGRPTTPFLEELAKEAVVFTRAHSNATWTQPSTVSFMTGLQHSVLGGLRRGIHSTSVPVSAVTMADHFRAAGYLTASFTANPNAGRIIGTDQGVDVMRDSDEGHHSESSLHLHRHLFQLREDYPRGPSWVHLQTTDVHEPNEPPEGFAGRYVTSEQRQALEDWDERIWEAAGPYFGTTSVQGFYDRAIEETGIDRKQYFGTRRGLYDETMNHQDHALEELVTRLKEEGRWENTLLVIGADHGHPAGTFARFGRGEIVPQPEAWQGAMCDAYATRVPLLFVWPGHIEGGRRIDEPVAMIDVLPTLLELVGLPPPEICQGQSLAPLLRGEDMDLAPVILDEFRVDEATGEMIGNLEMIQGRWGASLEIGPVPPGADPSMGRHSAPAGGRWGAVHPYFPEVPRLLLYDLQTDPFALKAVNDEHPKMVERFTELLLEQWQAHRALSQRFGEAEDVVMTPEQLEKLRALGYIR